MKKSKFIEIQILKTLAGYENGRKAVELWREYGLNQPLVQSLVPKHGGNMDFMKKGWCVGWIPLI